MKRYLNWTAALALLFTIACRSDQKAGDQAGAAKSTETKETLLEKYRAPAIEPVPVENLTAPTVDEVGSDDEVGVIDTDYGRIVVEFYPKVAPLHVANFKKLARAGFYDGTTFHRVIPGFVIQGGDPNSKDDDPRNDGMGGPPWHIKAEFNDKIHVKGILSMARSSDPNSAGSQFFICLGRLKNLDNQYTVFGNTIAGMEVVDDIGKEKRDGPGDLSKPMVKMRTVRIVKRGELGL